MKRFLTIAAVCASLVFFGNATNATAGNNSHGGHGVYQVGHAIQHGGYQSYGHGVVRSHYAPSYGYGYGSHRGVVPNYHGYQPQHGGYARSYRSYGHGSGLHLGVGRLHLGFGGHH